MSAVGRDVAPEAGMRVEHTSASKGTGTITSGRSPPVVLPPPTALQRNPPDLTLLD